MQTLERSRLIQERWFSLTRWLFIEAFFFFTLVGFDVTHALEDPLSGLLVAFTVYTLITTVLCVVLRSWPIGLAYATATADTLFAVLFVSSDPATIMNPALVGVAAASVGVGLRRFPVFETFAYSFIIAVGIVGARMFYWQRLTVDFPEVFIVGGVTLLPVLARVATLASEDGRRDDPAARLASRGLAALGALAHAEATAEQYYRTAAQALAQYTESPFGAVLLKNPDNSFELYSSVDGTMMASHLPAQADEQFATRLIAVDEPTVWTRRNNLQTHGLPDQYPARLDSALVVPLPNVSASGAVMFVANRRHGSYRVDDRVFAVVAAHDLARLVLTLAVARGEVATHTAALEALLSACDAKRPGSREQAQQCARLAEAVARELGWNDRAIDDLRLAAQLHDVGELAVPDVLLESGVSPQPEELDVLQQHPKIATRIIDCFNHSPLVLNAVYGHHERWDGRGYPSGLEGETIPLEARILCLADAVQSMIAPSPQRPPYTATEALQEIVKGSGTQFDPSIVQAFLAVLQREGPTFLEHAEAQVTPAAPDWGRQRVG